MLGFTRYVKPDYVTARPHRIICDAIDRVLEGKSRRLIIEAPPRHGKSEIVSRKLPAYYLGRFPRRSVIAASYGSELAADFGREVRNLVGSRRFSNLFPEVELALDSSAKDHWYTNQGGYYLSAGIGSGQGTTTTGRGANLLIVDDPIKSRAHAESETYREGLKSWYRSVAYTRLEKDEAIIVMATRWHEDDPIGWLISQQESGADQWERVTLPAVDLDPLGNKRALWPEKYSLDRLQQIRSVIKEYEWNALYMQRPRPMEGSYFTESDLLVPNPNPTVPDESGALKSHIPVDMPKRCDVVFAVIDSAAKTGKSNDGTAVTYFAYTDGHPVPLVVLDWDVVQIEGALLEAWLPTVFEYMETLARECGARFGTNAGVHIEDKSTGIVLLQQSQNKGLNVKAIDSKLTSLGKSERAINCSPYISQGKVKISRRAYDRTKVFKEATKNHFLSQVLGFRVGTKDMSADDLLDCATYGIALALGSSEGF